MTKTMVGIHVDDGLACSMDKTKLDRIIKHLEKEFKVKTNDVDYYVGFQVKVNEDQDKIFIHQSRYIKDILERFKMTDCHPISTPASGKLLREKKGSDDEELEEEFPYKVAVGSLMYAGVIIRPDISFVVSDVTRWSNAHRDLTRQLWRESSTTWKERWIGEYFTTENQKMIWQIRVSVMQTLRMMRRIGSQE
jgi:hypothetical protein